MTTFRARGTLMVQGTTSDAGKSTLVAGICRALARKGLSVAPFKPQNMALNSAVTKDGGEIGRAQALQAVACNLPPMIDMNPILLKPTTDKGAQVIVHGKALSNMQAQQYHDYKKVAKAAVFESYERLSQQFDYIIVEGAGSPAEINLRHNDIANMGFAEAADCPVIIVADIDRGGVFAHLVGTLELLSESEQARVVGFVINRFRGDINLLTSGLDWLEERTGKPVLGVLPYLHGLYIDAEDGVNPIEKAALSDGEKRLQIVIPGLPRISNHTDFDPLRLYPQVDVHYVREGQTIPPADLIILPGSKAVIADLSWLKQQGWEEAITRHLRYGGKVIGICGGYQMLGEVIKDPMGIEGDTLEAPGLGLLEIHTQLEPEKQLKLVSGQLTLPQQPTATVKGYEIHAGITGGRQISDGLITLDNGKNDGAISDDQQIFGTYLHGLFDEYEAMSAILRWAGLNDVQQINYDQLRQTSLNRLADTVELHINLDKLLEQL